VPAVLPPAAVPPVPAVASSGPPTLPVPVPSPPTPPVLVVADPVPVTPVPASGKLVKDLPRISFSRLPEVSRFAEALAVEYGRRVTKPDLLPKLQEATGQWTRRYWERFPPYPGETPKARAALVDKMVKAAQKTISASLPENELREKYREKMLSNLEDSWQRHVMARSTQAMPAHTLANLWMVNRNQELLFALEHPSRPPGSLDLFTHYRIMTPEEELAAPDGLAPANVDPNTVPGGRRVSAQSITTRAATFLKELHGLFPSQHWTTRGGHGSGGVKGRGLSVDLYLDRPANRLLPLPGLSTETFWERERMLELFHALEAAAAMTSFHFLAIYNDFSVARAANEFLTRGSVGFAGDIDTGGGLNYHGGGAVLHVHLDLIPDELVVLTHPPKRTK
jgi:hypothetical protein